MSLASAFEPAERLYKARVIEATFGHLNPKEGHAYRGAINVAVGVDGPVILSYKFRGLPDSPVLAQTIGDVFKWVPDVTGAVYSWVGYLIRYKNGKARLTKGVFGRCKVVHPFKVRTAPPKPTKTHKPIRGHEYLVQGHGKAVPVNDIATYKLYEVLDLTENAKVVFLHPTYEGCQNWIDGKPLDAPRSD